MTCTEALAHDGVSLVQSDVGGSLNSIFYTVMFANAPSCWYPLVSYPFANMQDRSAIDYSCLPFFSSAVVATKLRCSSSSIILVAAMRRCLRYKLRPKVPHTSVSQCKFFYEVTKAAIAYPICTMIAPSIHSPKRYRRLWTYEMFT